VSDTASKDASADKSGPTIRNILEERGFLCGPSSIVPDDEAQIQKIVKDWCDQGAVDCILTSGGTGFGVRDRTPEVSNWLNVTRIANLCYSGYLPHT
jgi:gephyrin